MHILSKLATLFLAGATITTVASAAPVTFFSSAATTQYDGYLPTNMVSTGMPRPTFDIGTGGVWTNPVGPSSWVSFDPNTAPGESVIAPNGYYSYFTSFAADPGSSVALTILADDTVEVYLSGQGLVLNEGSGPYPKCAVGLPNCVTPDTLTLNNLNALNGLDPVVHQANSIATGLDSYGTTVTLEPTSVDLLGTGLFGAVGVVLRRFRRV